MHEGQPMAQAYFCYGYLKPAITHTPNPTPSPGVVAESVERRPRMWEIGTSVLGRVNLMTYYIDTCCVLARRSALINLGKNWLPQCQDHVTEWDEEMGWTTE